MFSTESERRITDRRNVLLAWLCAAAAIAYVQRSGISVSAGQIMKDLAIDKRDLAVVMAAWGFGYAALQIPSGWLADRFGALRVLVLAVATWSLATGCVALADHWTSLVVLWTLMGMAQAGLVPCSAKAIGAAFPDAQRGTASGLFACAMLTGGALAPSVTALLLQDFTWPVVFAIFVIPGLAWAAFFSMWVISASRRSNATEPKCHMSESDATQEFLGPANDKSATANGVAVPVANERSPEDPSHRSATFRMTAERPLWRRMLGDASVWLLCAQQFLRAAAMVFFATWFPTYLQEARHVSTLESGVLTTWAGVGAVLGSVLGGLSSDFLLRLTGNQRLSRQGIAVVGMLSCSALILAAYFTEETRVAVTLIGLGAFCGTFGGVSGYTVAIRFGGRHVATLISLMNTCGNIGAGLFPLVAGWLVEQYGLWDPVLFLFSGIFLIDAVCWGLLNPKEPLDRGRTQSGALGQT